MSYHVVFRVKYSELWCADECRWVEHGTVVQAKSYREAKRLARRELQSRPRMIVGSHVSTQRMPRI